MSRNDTTKERIIKYMTICFALLVLVYVVLAAWYCLRVYRFLCNEHAVCFFNFTVTL